jgi:predicted permease
MSDADPGFRQDHILSASVGLRMAGYSGKEEAAIQHKILDRVAALPGVQTASLTDFLPLSLNGEGGDAYPEGYVPQLHEAHEVRRADVSPGYFAALRIPIVAGRDFTRDDAKEKAPRVVIIDQTAAARYWPGHDPIGRRINIFGQLFTVVGVAGNSKHEFMSEQPKPTIYLNFFQFSGETIVMVRTNGNPDSMAPAIEDAIHQVDRQLAVFDVRSLQETTQASNMFAIMESTFGAIFAVIALVLAATGIYGVVAYRTQLRTHEIGIRVALGASRSDVLRLVVFQGLWLTAVGLTLGLVLALGLTRFMAGLLYGISASDPVTIGSVVALLGLIAVLACYLPALRAMRVNPVAAIRAQ